MLEAQRTQLARRAPPVSEPSRTLPQAQRTEQFAEFLARSPELDGVVTVPKGQTGGNCGTSGSKLALRRSACSRSESDGSDDGMRA